MLQWPGNRPSHPQYHPVTPQKLAAIERSIPAHAVMALRVAQRRARASGVEVVLATDGVLYRLAPSGERTVLKTLPPRVRVKSRVKHATS